MNDESIAADWNRCERELSDFSFRPRLHIAQVAPLYESVPPKLYGGTERVVSYLTEQQVRQAEGLAEQDLNPVPVAQSDFTAGLASLVRAGLGIGWLPESLVAREVAAGTLRRVGDASLTARLEIRLHRMRTDKESGPAARVWRRAAQ